MQMRSPEPEISGTHFRAKTTFKKVLQDDCDDGGGDGANLRLVGPRQAGPQGARIKVL